MSVLVLLAVLVGTGAFAGLIAGLLGIGGGLVLVPAFHAVFSSLDYDSVKLVQICVATSSGTIIVNSLRSLAAHHGHGAVEWRTLRRWGPMLALGGLAGALGAASLRSSTLAFVFGGLAMAIGLYMIVSRPGWHVAKALPGRLAAGLYALPIGFLSSMMGIGGGSFGVPVLTLHGVPLHRAVATSAGFGLLISAPSFFVFLCTGWEIEAKPPWTVGFVNLPALCLVVLVSSLTVPLGARLAHRLPVGGLKRIFAIAIMATAANMLWTGLSERERLSEVQKTVVHDLLHDEEGTRLAHAR